MHYLVLISKINKYVYKVKSYSHFKGQASRWKVLEIPIYIVFINYALTFVF